MRTRPLLVVAALLVGTAVPLSAPGHAEPVEQPALRASSTLMFAADAPTLFVGEATSIGGWLGSGGADVAGVELSITRAATGEAPAALPPVTTRADGTFVLEDTPPRAGSYLYTATWAGDATRSGTSATASVTAAVGTWLELRVDRSGAGDGSFEIRVLVRHADGTSAAGRTVTISRRTAGTSNPLPPLVTDEWGEAETTDVPPPGLVTYRAAVAAYAGQPAASAEQTVTALVPTRTTLQAPDTADAGAPLALHGTLTAGPGPVAGATVTVARSGCGTAWTATDITTPNGAWSVTDPAAAVGACTYTAAYSGGGGYDASRTSASVTVLRSTTLTTSAPVSSDVGAPLTVSGLLSSGGVVVAGARITVTRSGCGAWSGATDTRPDGRWTLTDLAPPVGACTYSASYAGSGVLRPSSSSAATSVVLRTTALQLTAVRGSKRLVQLTARLGAWRTNATVTITAQPVGGTEVELRSAPVDATGTLTVSHSPRTTTTYRVRYAGDEWYAPATASQVL